MPVPVHHGVIVLLAGSNKFKYISLHVSAVFELHSGNNNGFLFFLLNRNTSMPRSSLH